MTGSTDIRTVATATLAIAYEEHGPPDGDPVVLLHGFPYSPRAYADVAPRLAEAGCRVVVPYLRGYGPTRFLSPETPRSGQQAALAHDLVALMDALGIGRAALAGYDWGGRAACIVAALWPERARCLVSGDGYNMHDVVGAAEPADPELEHRLWYQYYLHTPRGAAGLAANREAFCRLLWRLWSPTWPFDEATFAESADAFANPDFVDVVVHSYRVRYGYAPGDPAFEETERLVARTPPIPVPTISLCGADDGVTRHGAVDRAAARFTGPYERRMLPGIGHNIPQEAPGETARALFELMAAHR